MAYLPKKQKTMKSDAPALAQNLGKPGAHSIRILTHTAVILTIFLLTYAIAMSWIAWFDEKAHVVKDLDTVTELEAKALDRYFTHLESDLKGLAEDVTAQGEAINVAQAYRLLKRFKTQHAELFNVTLIRPDGEIVLSAKFPVGTASASLAKEASFVNFIDELKQGKAFGIGQPLLGVLSKVAIVPVRYAHQDAQGQVKFIVSANLPQDYLQSFWVDAPITATAAIGLIRDNGFLLSRYPVPSQQTLAQIYGQPRTGALINTLQAQGFPEHGQVEGPSSLDGPDFLTGFRRLAHYPVTVFVTFPLSELRALWWKRISGTTISLLLLLIGGWAAYGHAVRRQRAWGLEQQYLEEAQRASEQRFSNLVNHNNAIILQIDPASGQILAANAAAVNFYGWTHDALCAKTIQEINQFSPAAITAELELATQEQRNTFVFPHCLANGETRTVEVLSTPIIDGSRTVLVSIIHDISQRVRSEALLARLLQEQAAILNSRIVGIVKIKERKFMWSNAAFAAMLGYTEQELIGQSTRLLYSSDQDYINFAEMAYTLMQNGEIFRTEIQYRRKDGALGWYEMGGGLLVPGSDSDESIWAAIDISSRKESESALGQAHQAIKEAQRIAKVGSWQRDLLTDAITWSDEMYRIYDRDPQQFRATPETFLATIHPQDRDRSITAYRAAVEQHVPLDLSHRVLLPDGALKHVHVLGEVFYATDGSPLRIIGTTQDTSQQVLQAAQLSESEGRLRSLFSAMAEGLIVQEMGGRVTDANPAAGQILGLSHEEIMSRSSADELWQAIREDGTAFPGSEHPAMVALRTGQVQRNTLMSIVVPAQDGVRWININVQPVPGAASAAPQAVITTFTDITETRAIQAELAHHRQHLEDLVDQRTASLQIAKDAAEAANRAKSVFLSTMSHELRTPMNGIMGMTSIALRRNTDPKVADLLDKAMQSADRLLAIINNIIDISQLEAQRMSLEVASFTLERLREKLLSLEGENARKKGLTLTVEISPALARRPLHGDALRLGQVVANLTANAIKFTAQGSVTVRIEVCGERAGDLQLRFEVADSGIGISVEDQKRLFNIFEQADGSMTRKYGGTGLGLAICKRLVQAMGGSIGLNSQQGAGSTFWLVVPLKKIPETESTYPEP